MLYDHTIQCDNWPHVATQYLKRGQRNYTLLPHPHFMLCSLIWFLLKFKLIISWDNIQDGIEGRDLCIPPLVTIQRL